MNSETMWKIRRIVRIISGIIIFCSIVFILIKIKRGLSQIADSEKQELSTVDYLEASDSTIFSKKSWKDIKVIEVRRSKVRNAVAFLNFKKHFDIIVSKYDSKLISCEGDSIGISAKHVRQSVGSTYKVLDFGNYKVKYIYKDNEMWSHFTLCLNEDSWSELVKSNWYTCFVCSTRQTGLLNMNKSAFDFIIEYGDDFFKNSKAIQLLVCFVCRQRNTYVIYVISDNPTFSLERDFVAELLSNN